MEGEVKGKTFKMKGHTLPGINQRSDAKATNVAEQGLAGSSAFQFGVATAGLSAAEAMRGQVSNMPGGDAMGGVVMPDPSLTPPIVSKPSVAKIYDKPKGKRTEY